MMKTINNLLRHHAHKVAFALSCIAGLTFGSCAEDLVNGGENGGDNDAAVTFNVSSAQDDAQAAAAKAMPGLPVTRAAFAGQLALQNLTPEDLTMQKLAVQGAADLCLIETTVAGVTPMQQSNHATATDEKTAATRANITTMPTLGHFSSYGYRGNSATSFSATPDWFYNKDTKPDGTFVDPVYWAWDKNHFGKFYAVYPLVTSSYTKLTVSPESYTSTPYVDFEVEPDVKNQKDLMTACSGVVHYATQFVAPTTNLKFRHALTAVRFKVGQNLSYSKTITKVEIVGAKSKGRYTLSTDETGAGATWSNLSGPKTFTLGGDGTVNVSTSTDVNNIIMGKNNDNYVFYMIPQPLSGVQVKVYFDNNPTPAITANLAGKWKAGTTRTYALSQNTSDWTYILDVTPPVAAAYNATTTDNYKIQSYREDPVTHTQQPMKWKVIGYDTDGDGTFSMTEPWPSWFKGISTTSGNGSIEVIGETGTATLQPEATIIDKCAQMNAALKLNPKGSSTDYYDLSIHNIKGATVPRSTANCYVISHPGYYKIPLVYGNAITNGATNTNAYISQAPTGTPNEAFVLRHFKDHNNQDITDPWVEKTNGGANNGVNGAKIVWADEAGLVQFGSNPIVHNARGNAFVQFEVPTANIKNGNAVIAVTKDGTVVWSWHLWFIHDDALNTTACWNYQNKRYDFTQEILGMKYITWTGTTYTSPRSIKVKVEQEMPNGGIKQEGILTITQNPNNTRQNIVTYYQFGRKDALPGTKYIKEGTFNSAGDNMSIPNGIQHPENFYSDAGGSPCWQSNPPVGYTWYNLWSANNATTSWNDNPVVKTIYDPCPAGFKLPASNAFTGFTTNGENSGPINVTGTWDNGWNFNNKISNPDASVYFPTTGFRDKSGYLTLIMDYSHYWSAVPFNASLGCDLFVSKTTIYPKYHFFRAEGFPVHPVAE